MFPFQTRSTTYTLRTVDFKGLLTFRIPENWKMELESDMVSFYLDKPNSGTLRIMLNEFVNKNGKASLETFMKDDKNAAKALTENTAIKNYKKYSEERGHQIVLLFWELAQVSGEYLRIILFKYTILKSQEKLFAFQREIAMLNNEITNAKFII